MTARRRAGKKWRPTGKQLTALLGAGLLISQAVITLTGGKADPSLVLAGLGLLGSPLVKSIEDKE